jgi:hypothetical protein
MKNKIKNLLKGITGISTPFFGISWSQKENKIIEDDTIRFVTESVHVTNDGFKILFTIWNMTKFPITIFEFFDREYENRLGYQPTDKQLMPTFSHERFDFILSHGKSTLWDGITYKIESESCASFELDFIIEKKPEIKITKALKDISVTYDINSALTWRLFGIHVRFHDYSGIKKMLSSDAVFLYHPPTTTPVGEFQYFTQTIGIIPGNCIPITTNSIQNLAMALNENICSTKWAEIITDIAKNSLKKHSKHGNIT